MKDEFNKKKHIIVHDEDGWIHILEKAAIRLIEPYKRYDHACQSKIIFKEGREPFFARESVDDIAGVLHGKPSAADIAQWTADIIAARMQKARDAMVDAGLSFVLEKQKTGAEYKRLKDPLDRDVDKVLSEKEAQSRIIDGSLRLRIAEKLLSARERPHENRFAGFLREKAGLAFAGAEIALLHGHSRNQERLAALEKRAHHLQADHDSKLKQKEQDYNREMDAMRRQSQDPAMGREDRQILQKMMNEHRAGEPEPEFKYNRSLFSGIYYQPEYERTRKGEGTALARDIEKIERAEKMAREDAQRSLEHRRGRDYDRGPSR